MPRDEGNRTLATYLVDSTVLIEWLRGRSEIEEKLLALIANGHALATSCVNLAEVERGLRQRERRRATALLDRLGFLVTDPEAGYRAGRYQSEWAGRGHVIQTPDALLAGTARAHGAVLLTHNTDDFPMDDLRVEHPDDLDA